MQFCLSEILPEGEAPSELRLFRAGVNQTSKGDLLFDEASAALVMEDYAVRGNELPFDIGHDSLSPTGPVERHEAAGWFKPEVRPGEGGSELWASGIAWCSDIAEKIKARKYRYFSPAIQTDGEKRITRLVNVALTNLPATYGLTPMMASDLASELENSTMMPKICEMLGLDPATCSEADVMAALDTMMKSYADMKAKLEAPGEPEPASVPMPMAAPMDPMKCSEVDEVIVLSGISDKADWKGAIVALSSEVRILRSEKQTAKVDAAVEDAIKARKLSPAQRDAAKALGLVNLQLLSDFISNAVPVVGESYHQPETQVVTLSSEEREVCRKLGVSEADFAATKAQSVK